MTTENQSILCCALSVLSDQQHIDTGIPEPPIQEEPDPYRVSTKMLAGDFFNPSNSKLYCGVQSLLTTDLIHSHL